MNYNIFRDELGSKYPTNGHALWEPDSGGLYDCVEVGDVGFIRKGRFRRLFNALLPEGHPKQSSRVPEYHTPLEPNMDKHIEKSTLDPIDFCSREVIAKSDEPGILALEPEPSKVTFSCSRRQGAVLSLPVPAQSADSISLGDFAKWIIKHIDVWFAFARDLGLGINRAEDLILVTGRDLARSSTNVAFSVSQREEKVSFGFTTTTNSSGVNIQWQFSRENTGVTLKRGPNGHNLPENRCIFVRGYRVTRFMKVLPKLRAAANPSEDSGEHEAEFETQLITIPETTNDPLHTILGYLSTQSPECNMGIVHDNDLVCVDGTSLENLQPDTIIGHLQDRKPKIYQAQCDWFSTCDGDSETETPGTKVATLSKRLADNLGSENALEMKRNLSTSSLAAFPHSKEQIDAECFTQKIVSSSPLSHPERANYLGSLAWWRFCHSGSPEQLEKYILHSTEALLLPLPRTGRMSDYVRRFYRLALALDLRSRSTRFEKPEPDDVTYCVKYLRYLLDQPLEAFGLPRNIIKSCLVEALEAQVSSSSDDVTEDIKTAMILCCELFDSDPKLTIPSFIALAAGAASATSKRSVKGQLRDQVIESLRKAIDRLPHDYQLSRWLASCLIRRFEEDYSLIDYDEAITVLKRVLDPNEPEDSRSLDRGLVLAEIAHCSYIRFLRFRKPEYREEAISHLRTYRHSASIDPRLPALPGPLEHLLNLRVGEFGVGGAQENCSSASASNPDIVDLSCLSSLIASLTGSTSLITDEQWEKHRKVLESLMRATDMGENEDAIKYCQLLLARGNPGNQVARFVPVSLAILLYDAFINSGKLKYLDESIVVLRDCLETPNDWHRHHNILAPYRIMALSCRFRLFESREDLHELMQVYSAAVTNTQSWISERFRLSYEWACLAHSLMHPSVTTAYGNAFSIMQDSLSRASTLEMQHFRLVSMRESYEKLPSNYAAYQVYMGQVSNAIEILEQGRALIWSELRGFRTSADQIGVVNPALAEAFVTINEELEKVTMSIGTHGDEIDDPEGMDQSGRQVVQQRKLLEQRDKLIEQIRALPSFGSFLKPRSFDALRSAALRGPVIIINHCKWRSDILILLHNSPPSLITTKNDFYDSALELGDRLAKNIKYGLESKQYQRALRSVLKDLYELVGRPVIEEFRKMKIPEQSRVWWCPTSVFCYLPLHAMGPIPSDDGIKRHFSDLYITSYTSTLSALIESRKPRRQTSGKPSILLVAQPESIPLAVPEIWALQRLSTTVTSLISKKATPSSVLEGLKNHQFTHFACHGKLKAGEPFNASFKLSGGKQLTLLDVVRSRLPSTEFAFLSACRSARVTEEGIADEAVHFAAAMQYCGFRSVVGTMWKMADVDGQYLVEDFYKLLQATDEPGIPYHERSARALRDAVKNLRRKGVPLERWVNYVHYGA